MAGGSGSSQPQGRLVTFPQAMSASPAQAAGAAPWRRMIRQIALGYGFWLAFLLVLEPGNLIRAARAGLALSASSEALRMACAALMGAIVTPGVFWLSRRLPVRGARGLRNGALLLGAFAALALALITIGALMSAWLPPNAIRGGVAEQVGGNLLLLTLAMAVLAAAPQLRDVISEARARRPAAPAAIPVKRRGETLLVQPGEIDWIEAQGNYLALHVGTQVHTIRGTLGRMERDLDPGCFLRIHRRAIVNVARVRRLQPIASGDALIQLDGGAELRVSRSYGKALKEKLPS